MLRRRRRGEGLQKIRRPGPSPIEEPGRRFMNTASFRVIANRSRPHLAARNRLTYTTAQAHAERNRGPVDHDARVYRRVGSGAREDHRPARIEIEWVAIAIAIARVARLAVV